MVLCACGCGCTTRPSMVTNAKRGVVRGQPNQYIKGHNPGGNPYSRRRPILDRFWERVIEQPYGCWEWVGSRNHGGYGIFSVTVGTYHARHVLAHRFALELLTAEEVPDGVFVCHRCDNPPCVNPAHLFLGDRKANARDMVAKGREARGDNGRHGIAKLTPVAVISIRESYASGQRLRALTRQYGVSARTLLSLVRGETWRRVGGPIAQRRRVHSAASMPIRSLVSDTSEPATVLTPPNDQRTA